MTTTDALSPRATPGSATGVDRRRALCGLAGMGVGVPLLAACGGRRTSETGATSPPARGPLAGVDEVPVGGAYINEDLGVVVTQPSRGEFRGYDATCSHQGCAVRKVEGAEVVCTCHGSRFSAADGSVVKGPAPDGLEEVPVTVDGDQVVRG